MPKESVGLFWTISGAGGLLGSLLVLLLGNRRRSEAVLLTGLFLRGISLIWYAVMTSYAWAIPAAFFAGLGDDFILVALFSLMMQRTKPQVLGRVRAFSDTASALTTFLALVTSIMNSPLPFYTFASPLRIVQTTDVRFPALRYA